MCVHVCVHVHARAQHDTEASCEGDEVTTFHPHKKQTGNQEEELISNQTEAKPRP